MSAGERSCATSTRGVHRDLSSSRSVAAPVLRRGSQGGATGLGCPFMWRRMRSTVLQVGLRSQVPVLIS